MTENSAIKPRGGFWAIGIFALLWNLMGVYQYLYFAFMTEDKLATFPENEQALYVDVPAWATAAFALAVWCGLLGSILLLMRKKWAKSLFIISLIGIIVQMYHYLFMTNSPEIYGPGVYVMPILVVVIGAFLIWYSKDAHNKGYLS